MSRGGTFFALLLVFGFYNPAHADALWPARIDFPPAVTELSSAQKTQLAPVAAFLARSQNARLALASMAAHHEGGGSEAAGGFRARALALERALVVRAWLAAQSGADENRMILKPAAGLDGGPGWVEISLLNPPDDPQD